MSVFRMPSLGADMEAGTLVEWLVAPGDTVKRGDIVAVVETQKGAIEIEIFEAGTVDKLLAEIGQTLPVGAPMAAIASAGGTRVERPRAAAPEPSTPAAIAPAAAEPAVLEPARAPATLPPSSPAARRKAHQAGIALATLKGSGPGGAIVLADVEQATVREAPAPEARPSARGFDPKAMRDAIATAMARSKREIPHYYLAHEIDLQRATDWLAEINAARQPQDRLVMALLLMRAVARAVRKAPQVNGVRTDDGTFRPADRVNVGVAISLRGGGLVAPALHDTDGRPLDELMASMRDLVTRARTARLRSSEFSDPTITVSSLGERGVDAIYGVIFPPQVAIVGFGAPVRRPAVVGDAVVPRTMVTATLAADHRVSDGRLGARFLSEVDDRLQSPEVL